MSFMSPSCKNVNTFTEIRHEYRLNTSQKVYMAVKSFNLFITIARIEKKSKSYAFFNSTWSTYCKDRSGENVLSKFAKAHTA